MGNWLSSKLLLTLFFSLSLLWMLLESTNDSKRKAVIVPVSVALGFLVLVSLCWFSIWKSRRNQGN